MFIFKFKTENWREFGVTEGRPVELTCRANLPVERDEDENIPDLERNLDLDLMEKMAFPFPDLFEILLKQRSQQRRKAKTEAEWDSWETLQKEDPIEAMIALQKRLETFSVVRSYKWDDYMYSTLPTSLLPKTVKNAEIINAILVKSWEMQGSHCPKIPGSAPLVSKNCVAIHSFLMHYFKSMNIADNMERIIGSLDRKYALGFGTFPHSYLKIGGHIIDNTFNENDPADPKYGVLPQSSEIGNDKCFNSLPKENSKFFSYRFGK